MMQTVLSAATCVLCVILIVVNYVATSETIGAVAFTNRNIADTHPVYGLPNGWAFAIWGIIFLFLGVYTIYQALPAKYYGGFECDHVAKIRLPALAMMVCNSVWNYLFGWEVYWMALLDIVVYDVLLWVIIIRLGINYFAPIRGMSRAASIRTKLCLVAPFSIHAGWVTVATTLNVQVNLLEEGYFPSADFSIGIVWTAAALGIYLTIYRHADLPYTLVTIWALGGIISNQSDGSTWGCASRICGSCLNAALAICSRANSAGVGMLPNGWGQIDCNNWSDGANMTGWATALAQRGNDLDCGLTVVPKSDAVIAWFLGGIATVTAAFCAGLIHVCSQGTYVPLGKMPVDMPGMALEKQQQEHALEAGETPQAKDAM